MSTTPGRLYLVVETTNDLADPDDLARLLAEVTGLTVTGYRYPDGADGLGNHGEPRVKAKLAIHTCRHPGAGPCFSLRGTDTLGRGLNIHFNTRDAAERAREKIKRGKELRLEEGDYGPRRREFGEIFGEHVRNQLAAGRSLDETLLDDYDEGNHAQFTYEPRRWD